MILIGKENEIGKKYFNKKVELNELSKKYSDNYPGGLLISYLLGKCEELKNVEVQIDIASGLDGDDETSCIYNKKEFLKNFKTIDDFLNFFCTDDIESWNVTLMYESEEIRIFGILYNPLSYEVNVSYEDNKKVDRIISMVEGMTIQ